MLICLRRCTVYLMTYPPFSVRPARPLFTPLVAQPLDELTFREVNLLRADQRLANDTGFSWDQSGF